MNVAIWELHVAGEETWVEVSHTQVDSEHRITLIISRFEQRFDWHVSTSKWYGRINSVYQTQHLCCGPWYYLLCYDMMNAPYRLVAAGVLNTVVPRSYDRTSSPRAYRMEQRRWIPNPRTHVIRYHMKMVLDDHYDPLPDQLGNRKWAMSVRSMDAIVHHFR